MGYTVIHSFYILVWQIQLYQVMAYVPIRPHHFQCITCQQYFPTQEGLSLHACSFSKPIFPCTICGFKFYTPIDLNRHVGTIHNQMTTGGVTILPKLGNQENNTGQQKQQVGGEKQCPICQKTIYSGERSMKRHIRNAHQ